MNTVRSVESISALSNDDRVKEFSQATLHLSMGFQEVLKRLSEQSKDFPSEGYGLLTEAYGLRARANILYLAPSMHVVTGLNFSQVELLDALSKVSNVLKSVVDLRVLNSMLVSVITFASALGAGRERVVNFLFDTLISDMELWIK